jgi:hypothetical protein
MLILHEKTLLFDTQLNSCYTARLFGIDKKEYKKFPGFLLQGSCGSHHQTTRGACAAR